MKKIFRTLFGSVSWDMPKWAKWIQALVLGCFSSVKSQHQTSPKKLYSVLGGIAAVVVISYFGYQWYINRPQPVKFSVSHSYISPTAFWLEDSEPDTFDISFGGSAAKMAAVDKVVTAGITVTPKIEGEWRWAGDDKLVFTVAGDWPVGKNFKVKLSKKLFPSHVHLEKYEVKMDTPKFEASITNHEFYQNPTVAKEKKVVSEIIFSHPVDQASVKKNVELVYKIGSGAGRTVKTEKVKYTLTFDKHNHTAYLVSEILAIPNYESEMELGLGKGVKSSLPGPSFGESRSQSVTVPGMLTHFKFSGADLTLVRNEKYEPEQVLVLNSSAEVSQKDLAKSLEVYVLPKDRPKGPGVKFRRNHYWSVDHVSAAIVKLSAPLELDPIPTEKDYSKILSFKYKAKPGAYVYIRIKKGLKAFGGYKLPQDYSFVQRVPEFPKEIKIMAEGSLLSLAGDKKLSILARDMEYVRYRAQRLLPGQIAHLVTQSGGSIGDPSFNNWSFNLENIAQTFSEVKGLPVVGLGKTQYSHFDFSGVLNRTRNAPKGLYYFTAEGWDKVNDRQRGPKDERFILVTDLGVLAKKSVDGSYDVFVQSIDGGGPVSDASVEVIGKNGLAIMSKLTGGDGHVRFPSLEDFRNEKSPVVFVVRKGADLSFLPVSTHVNELNYSRFDIGGVRSGSATDRLEAYMFSDRGIYRPGEKVNIGYVVKHSDWSRDLSGLNLEMKVTDPKGSQIRYTKKISGSKVGLKAYSFQTGETWPTGTYDITLYSRKSKHNLVQIGSTSVKVEEFMPDRLKITAKFSVPANKGWLNPNELKGMVNLQNLFGTAAQNRRIIGEISLVPSYTSFDGFKEWRFHDPMRSKKSFEEQLGEQKTDSEGNTTFDLGLNKFESASYLLRFMAEGFEAEGGRSVLASNAVLISPLKYLVGYKAQGDLNYISKGTDIGVDIIAVDPDLAKTSAKGLFLKTIEFRQVSTLVKQSNGTYKYESVKKEYELSKEKFSIAAAGSSLTLDTKAPGEFSLVILNADGLELNRVNYSIAGSANLSFALEKNAELQVKLNKSDFDPGEEIEISIRSPYAGAGLITIERERVLTYKWFTSSQNSTVQRIRIPDDLEGNGYVNVTFVRSISSNEIFMSPLSTGVAAFSINKASRINTIALKVPQLVRPGKKLKIDVSARQSGKAIVFAVDEGILQVAKYKNPDPLSSFYKKRALEVETRQILDLILPEFSKLEMRRSSEAGGASSLLGKNLNPFKRKRDKAVAYWSGVIDIGPDGKTLTYNVPEHFAGQLRVIAVAISQEAMDAAADKTLVKGHFILSPNTPNFVAPGDKLKISVGVSNNVKDSGKSAEVSLKLATTENIEILGDALQTLKIDEGSETSATFDVLVKEPLGNANFTFTAAHGKKSSRRRASTSVRPAMPYITTLQSGFVENGKDIDLKSPRRMFKEFRTNEISVSKIPMSLANSFVNYLRKYPYGCTEQVISKGMPAITFGGYKEFKLPKHKVASQVEGITEILASRQLPGGGFGKWPGHSYINAFHSAYATHYLTEAKDRGYRIPKATMDNVLSYLKEYAEEEPENIQMARVQAYAAYLLTRNDIIATKSLTNLEKWLEGYKDDSWVKDVMLLYMASAYKNMKATAKATKLLNRYDDADELARDYSYGVYNSTIKRAMHLYLVAKHFPSRIKEFDGERLGLLVKGLSANFNTTSSAMAILAFEAYAKLVKADSVVGILVSEVLEKSRKELKLKGTLFPKASFAANSLSVEVDNTTKNVAYYSMTQAGFNNSPNKVAQADSVEVFREFHDKGGNKVNSAKIGDELTVQIRSRSISGNPTYNVAIVDLLPGGFEVVLDSVERVMQGVDYVDAREDRVLIFRDFSKDVDTYSYRIKAINKGEYQVPPIYSESMYDQKIRSKGLSGTITVE